MIEFETGSIVDERYEIQGLLGSGGMGRVYKARQLNLDRAVAIKVPSQSVLENDAYLSRFIREAQACARVAHENIVAIYDVKEGELPYIVMEFVNGDPLHRFLKQEHTAVFVQDLLDIVRQTCDGLEAAHAAGVVHRDIKPANIVITSDTQRVKIMDFGIARVADSTSVTNTGSMMGTPYYMAPEQIRGQEVGPETDIYALSCLVYQLFTGRPVFEGEVATLVFLHVSQEPVDPCKLNPLLPRETGDVLLRGLAKNPADRFHSTSDLYRQINRSLRPVANLPYTQVFAMRDPNTAPTGPAPRETASRETIRADKAPSHAAVAAAEAPSGPQHQADPLADTLTPPGQRPRPSEAEADAPGSRPPPGPEPTSRSKRSVPLVALALLAAAVAGGVVAWALLRPGQEKPPDIGPAAAARADAALAWPGQPPRERYAPGEYLMAVWMVDPPEAARADRPYLVELLRAGDDEPVLSRLTATNRLALRLETPGDYTLRILSPKGAGLRLRPLVAPFTVAP